MAETIKNTNGTDTDTDRLRTLQATLEHLEREKESLNGRQEEIDRQRQDLQSRMTELAFEQTALQEQQELNESLALHKIDPALLGTEVALSPASFDDLTAAVQQTDRPVPTPRDNARLNGLEARREVNQGIEAQVDSARYRRDDAAQRLTDTWSRIEQLEADLVALPEKNLLARGVDRLRGTKEALNDELIRQRNVATDLEEQIPGLERKYEDVMQYLTDGVWDIEYDAFQLNEVATNAITLDRSEQSVLFSLEQGEDSAARVTIRLPRTPREADFRRVATFELSEDQLNVLADYIGDDVDVDNYFTTGPARNAFEMIDANWTIDEQLVPFGLELVYHQGETKYRLPTALLNELNAAEEQ